MALIRHAQAKELAREAYVLDLGDLQRQAEALKARAEAEASAIVGDAHEERRRIVSGAEEEGYARGHESGLARGLEEGRAEGRASAEDAFRARFETLSASMESALGGFESAREALVLHAQEDGLWLVLEIARRVTRRSAEVDHVALGERIAEAVRRAIAPSGVVVRVHPEDESMAREALPSLMGRADASGHAEVRGDASLNRGDAVIESGRGTIDARIGEQLDRVIGALMPASVSSDEGGGSA